MNNKTTFCDYFLACIYHSLINSVLIHLMYFCHLNSDAWKHKVAYLSLSTFGLQTLFIKCFFLIHWMKSRCHGSDSHSWLKVICSPAVIRMFCLGWKHPVHCLYKKLQVLSHMKAFLFLSLVFQPSLHLPHPVMVRLHWGPQVAMGGEGAWGQKKKRSWVLRWLVRWDPHWCSPDVEDSQCRFFPRVLTLLDFFLNSGHLVTCSPPLQSVATGGSHGGFRCQVQSCPGQGTCARCHLEESRSLPRLPLSLLPLQQAAQGTALCLFLPQRGIRHHFLDPSKYREYRSSSPVPSCFRVLGVSLSDLKWEGSTTHWPLHQQQSCLPHSSMSTFQALMWMMVWEQDEMFTTLSASSA